MRFFVFCALVSLAIAVVLEFAKKKRFNLLRFLSIVLLLGIIGAYVRRFIREFQKT